MTIVKHYSFETDSTETYEKLFEETVYPVKGEDIKIVAERYKRLSDGEYFEPFDNPDKNLRSAFALYRQRHHMLTPDKVRSIREKYGMTVRDFAKVLGIGYANLSAIENGSLQAPYIDSLLRFSDDPYAFKSVLTNRREEIPAKVYSETLKRIEKDITFYYDEHKQIAEQVFETENDIRANLVITNNQSAALLNEIHKIEGGDSWGKPSTNSWTQKLISSIAKG